MASPLLNVWDSADISSWSNLSSYSEKEES
jgi:hypothetical protein